MISPRRRGGKNDRKEAQEAQDGSHFGVRHLDAALEAATCRRTAQGMREAFYRTTIGEQKDLPVVLLRQTSRTDAKEFRDLAGE